MAASGLAVFSHGPTSAFSDWHQRQEMSCVRQIFACQALVVRVSCEATRFQFVDWSSGCVN